MSSGNTELHLLEKAGQALGVDPTASGERIVDAFSAIPNPSPLQKMARDVLVEGGTPDQRRRAIEKWRGDEGVVARALADTARATKGKGIRKVQAYEKWQRERAAVARREVAQAAAQGCATLYFATKLVELMARNHKPAVSKRVILNMKKNPRMFLDALKALKLIDPDGSEIVDKVISLELDPVFPSFPSRAKPVLRWEIRYVVEGRRGGVTDHSYIDPEKQHYYRFPSHVALGNEEWDDFLLSTILKRFNKNLSPLHDGLDQGVLIALATRIADLREGEVYYPESIREMERMIPKLVNHAALKRFKAAARMRAYRAKRAQTPQAQQPQPSRKEYMRRYRLENRDHLREKQKEYSQNWRRKKKVAVAASDG